MQPAGHLSHPMTLVKSNYWLFKMKALWEVGPFMEEDFPSVVLFKGKPCDSGFRKSKEFCGQVVVKRPLLWKDQCKKRFLHVASNWSKEQRDRKGQKGYIGFTAFAAPSLLGQRLMATNEPTNHLVIGSLEVVPPKARRLDSLWSIRTRSSLPTVRADKSMASGCF